MAFIRLQGENERKQGIYYEYDPAEVPLGEGGMGRVYRGWCCSEVTNQRREVAIKFLYTDLPAHVIARARREAGVQLKNDNLIEMLGFMEIKAKDELGQPVVRYHVVSEYLHGVTLDKLLEGKIYDYKGDVIPFAQDLHGKSINSPYGFALMIVRSLLSGLMALHDGGYIHRDIDPSNIMVTSDGKIKLIDFGIAKKINGNNTHESSYTVAGQFIGKPKYASPELARGFVDSQNATTDLYAVGILLYQLLMGRVPFDGEMADVLDAQINKKMPLGNIKQKHIRAVIDKATRKKQSQRFQSAAEFRVAVDKLVPLQYPEANWLDMDIKKVLTLSGGIAAAVGLVILGINLIKNDSNDDDDIVAENINANDIPPSSVVVSKLEYADAVRLLYNRSTASEGLSMLRDLADNKDYQSCFLLSRLYLDNNDVSLVGTFSDSVNVIKNNLMIPAQNDEAHRLLKKAVAIKSDDYKSLYELGCDYKSGKRGPERLLDSAYIFLDMAKHYAVQSGDKLYEDAIVSRMSNLESVTYKSEDIRLAE